MGQAMAAARGEVRIIGGEWRGRPLRFPAGAALRPTPGRVRETLFNWLRERVEDARVLDLFAGSGALGLEALSRGAARVQFVERRRAVAAALRANIERLGAGDRAGVYVGDALKWLHASDGPLDLVFLDPPYASGYLPQILEALTVAQALLAPGHRVYIEYGSSCLVPADWEVLRETRAGEVHAALLHLSDDAR